MEEPEGFGAMVNCQHDGWSGLAIKTGNKQWLFRPTTWKSVSGLEWRDLHDPVLLRTGVIMDD